MRIIVCPSESLAALCRSHSPSHVVSLAAPDEAVPRLAGPANHLALAFNDITAPRKGLAVPDEAAVARLLAFGLSWDGSAPLVASCRMGISRSSAAAFCLACQASAATERAVADALRRASPHATPNALVVSLADALLAREGRMSAAVAAIGRGADYVPFRLFEFDVPPAAASAE